MDLGEVRITDASSTHGGTHVDANACAHTIAYVGIHASTNACDHNSAYVDTNTFAVER